MALVSLRHGWSEYWATQSPRVLGGVVLPRILFQAAFFILLAGLAGSRESTAFAFVGVTAYALTLPAFFYSGLRYGTERWQGTLIHLELASLPAAGVHVIKCWMQVIEGLIYAAAVLLVIGPVFGLGRLSVALLEVAYVYPLMGLSLLALSAALVVLVPKGRELLALNTANSFMLVFAGVIFPPTAIPGGGFLSQIIPMGNGIRALRASLVGEPFVGHLLAEVAVGAGWFLAAVVLHRITAAIQRRTGRGSLVQ